MNILIIEDIDEKASAVENCLLEICKNGKVVIRRAKSIAGALRVLDELHFDLVVLDFVLPLRDDAKPVNHGGADLLDEIVNGDVKKPTHVICLTEFPEASANIESQIARSLTHIIVYSDSCSDWHEALRTKCDYIRKRLNQADATPGAFLADIAIVTSSPVVEFQEVLRLEPKFLGEFHSMDALHYYLSDWRTVGGRNLQVVACAAPQMGMTVAAVTASKLIERWRPRFIVMCGIAAGVHSELNLGDILVGETVYDYGSGKISESRTGKRVFVPDPRPLNIDVELKALLQEFEREQTGVAEFMKDWRGAAMNWTPKMRVGILASGAAVVQSKDLVDEIVKTSRKTVGLEMEAYGVFQAAALARDPRPRVLIAKSVCDFADSKKADNWHQLAAFTSARVVQAFFTRCEGINW